MTDRLTINDQEIDLYPGTRIAITLQVNDLADLGDRQTARSNSFTIPRTANNDAALGFAALPPSETDLPYRRLRATYTRGGINLLGPSTAVIDEAGDEYKVVLVSRAVDLFALLDERTLADLDLSDLNHTFDLTTIIGSRTNTEGIIYPLAAYTIDPAYIDDLSSKWDIRRVQFCLYAHTLVRRIIQEAGYSLSSGSFYETDPVASRLLLHASPDKWGNTGKILTAYKTTPQLITISNTRVVIDDDSSGDPVLRTGAFDISNAWQTAPAGSTLIRYYHPNDFSTPRGGRVRFTVYYSFTLPSSASAPETMQIRIVTSVSGTERITASGQFHTIQPGQTISGIETIQLPDGSYQAGDYTELTARIISPTAGGATDSVLTIGTGTRVEAWLYSEAPFAVGDLVPVAEQLPEMKQKDFLKGISQLFCLNWNEDLYRREFDVVSFNQISGNRFTAPDWSDKLHMGTRPESSFRLGKYARKNWMKYKEDDAVSEGYGDGSFPVDDETLDAEATLFTLPFAATENVTLLGGYTLPLIERWKAGDTIPKVKVKPRILLLSDGANPGASVDYYDGTTTTTVTTDLPWCHFIHPEQGNNLGFGDSLIRDYYAPVVAMLTRARKVVVDMRLTEADLVGIDFTKPIYLNQLGGYFYVNKVSNALPGRLVKVELVRL